VKTRPELTFFNSLFRLLHLPARLQPVHTNADFKKKRPSLQTHFQRPILLHIIPRIISAWVTFQAVVNLQFFGQSGLRERLRMMNNPISLLHDKGHGVKQVSLASSQAHLVSLQLSIAIYSNVATLR
jgi:hypothetical protein